MNDKPVIVMSGKERLQGLDHLRALAIILVFIYHYDKPMFGHPEWLRDVAKFGWTGVDLFFVLSGFLISSQLFVQIRNARKIAYSEFFVKRFFRIIPAYCTVVAIYFCFPAFHERPALSPLWKFLTFTQNLGLNQKTHGTFSHAWSLCVEEHFYFVLPLILILLLYTKLFSKAFPLLAVLFASVIVLRNYIWHAAYVPVIDAENAGVLWYKYIYYPSYTRLDGLLVGVSIAALWQFAPGIRAMLSKLGNVWIALSLVVLAVAYFICYDERSYMASIFGFAVVALGYGLLVLGGVSTTSFLYRCNSKVTTFIAALSYSIYLTHKGVTHITQAFFSGLGIEPDSNVMMLICIVCCVAAGWLLNIAIEKPFMKLRNVVLSRTGK